MTEFRPSSFQILPTVVKNLLIINGLFFLAQKTLGEGAYAVFSFEDNLGLHAWQSELFKPWQLVTHMFLHGDFYHIFGNMFALWMFGSVLENLWGSKRFLIFYFICGLGAALIHLLFLSYELVPMMRDYVALANQRDISADSMLFFCEKHNISEQVVNYIRSNAGNPAALSNMFDAVTIGYRSQMNNTTIGASGAIFGVLAAFVYLFPNTYLYLYFLVPIKAKWLGLAYFSYELFFAVRNSAGDNVARWAHVGGAIVGLLIVITWNRTNKKQFY